MSFISWLRNQNRSGRGKGRSTHDYSRQRSTFRPRLETLEDRTLLSTFYAATASDLISDINAANKGSGANTIVLTAPGTSPYSLAAVDNSKDGPTVLPVISKKDSLTIVGNGDTIDASNVGRLFDVAGGASLTLNNVTLQHGHAQPARATAYSADGGAIYNQGTLALSQVTVQNNTADGFVEPGAGGGIWSNGSLTVTNSTIDANGALSEGGGPAFGGGIYIAGGTANITGSAFGNPNGYGGNTAKGATAYGGAIYVAAGTVTLRGDTFGDVNYPGYVDGNSALAGYGTNFAGGYGYGGAVYVAGGNVTLTNDSIQGNYVDNIQNTDGAAFGNPYQGYGGGIYIASGATVYIDSFTVNHTVNNGADVGANIWGPYTLLP